jgi:hypothetical protein
LIFNAEKFGAVRGFDYLCTVQTLKGKGYEEVLNHGFDVVVPDGSGAAQGVGECHQVGGDGNAEAGGIRGDVFYAGGDGQ